MPISEPQTASQAVLTVHECVGIARVFDWAVFTIDGSDASPFLQNRLSNDILALKPGEGQLNATLDRQGRIEGVFSLHKTDPGSANETAPLAASDFFLLIEAAAAEQTVAATLKYRIMEQVTMTDCSAETALFVCEGPKSADVLAALGAEAVDIKQVRALAAFYWLDVQLKATQVRVIRRQQAGENGYWLLVAAKEADAFEKGLQQAAVSVEGVVITPDVLETLRIEAGIPRYGIEYGHETLLPETGLERLAVSYSKGCYLGQETIARIRTYGSLPKALTGLIFGAGTTLPETGTPIFHEGREVGTLRSHTYSPRLNNVIAMATLGKGVRTPGQTMELHFGPFSEGQQATEPVQATVTLLPFYEALASEKTGQDWLKEGLSRFSEGLDEEAIRLLREAIKVQPDGVEAYEALGVILARQDRYDEAIALMEQVLTLDADHVLAHTNLSVYYMRQGDQEKAETEKGLATMAAFRRKAKEAGLTPVDVAAKLEEERQRKEQATREKIILFLQALQFNPEDPLGNFGLGSAYLELGQFAEAIEPLQKTIQAQPKHSVAYLSLGKALEATQRTDEARTIYQQGMTVASARGDLMPLQEMQTRLAALS